MLQALTASIDAFTASIEAADPKLVRTGGILLVATAALCSAIGLAVGHYWPRGR